MAGVSIKYFAALLLIIGLRRIEIIIIIKEKNQLIFPTHFRSSASTALVLKAPKQTVTRETILRNCINRVEDRFDPTASRDNVYGPDEPLLLKYGLEDIQKVVEQKYETFFEEILQQIKEYLKGLTPEQQRNTTARNLKGWSSKIKAASTLARKEMTFRSFMRYYFMQESD
ncbi:uncharacterized protein LOC126754470 [Bactrocera neohumeralis]|uniref:uncharacterized protein LOC126754470 n=1 Tax=Bactrocera neohumeralis TaxID=98809 RepID=UPI00216575B7|nr:uncharacterized protein LOC126754470 [Bactrocera neohumeralis]